MNRKIFTCFFILLLACLSLHAESAYPHYELDLTIVPEKGTIEGEIKIALPWTEERNAAGSSLYFMLPLNMNEKRNPHVFGLYEDQGPHGFTPAWIKIPRVLIDGIEASASFVLPEKPFLINYNQDHLILKVDVPIAPETGKALDIIMSYQAQFPNKKGMDDFYFDDMMISRFSWLPVPEPPGFSLSRIPFAQYFFTFHGVFRLSSGWIMAAQGTLFETNGENTFEAASASPVSSVPLVLLKNYQYYETQTRGDEKIVRAYHKKGNDGPAQLISSYSVDILDYYSRTYFPLANKYISIVQGTPGAYGMACDSIVVVGDVFFSGLHRGVDTFFDPFCDYLLAHEIMHFYSGIGAEPDFLRENYLSEGITEYGSISYIESKYGIWNNMFNSDTPDLFSKILHYIVRQSTSTSWRGGKILSTRSAHIDKWDKPLSGEPEDRIVNTMGALDYDKSFFIIRMLSYYLGKDDFQKALKLYLEENMGKIVNSESLKSSLEKYYNKDLDHFFDCYVYGNKSVDYAIKGKLNKAADGGYSHTVEVMKNDKEEFIPTVLTAFLSDKTKTTIAIASAGTYDFTTEKSVRYVGIDSDADFPDYDRSNNFYPPQIACEITDEYWLTQGEAALFFVRPFYQHVSGSVTSDYIGLGPYIYDRFFWDLLMFPYIRIDSTPTNIGAEFRFGGGVVAGASLPGHNYFSLMSLVDGEGIVEEAVLSYSHDFYFDRNIGSVSHYYHPGLSLNLAAGIRGWDFGSSEKPSFIGHSGLAFDNLYFSGTYADIGNDFIAGNESDSEDRISARIIQCFTPFNRILFGLTVSGSVHFGNDNLLNEGNYVKGFPASPDANDTYRAACSANIGFPFLNDIELPLLNWFVLQSINNVLFCDAAANFNSPDEWQEKPRYSAGIEQVFCFRTVMDIPFVIGYGLAFDLYHIFKFPDDPVKYIPAFFIDLDVIPLMYGSAAAY